MTGTAKCIFPLATTPRQRQSANCLRSLFSGFVLYHDAEDLFSNEVKKWSRKKEQIYYFRDDITSEK